MTNPQAFGILTPVIPNPQYDYDFGPYGRLAPLHARSSIPDYPAMIAPPLGWLLLVIELNEELEDILPDYTIAQVKEKYAGLRYYIHSFGVAPDDPRIDMARALIADAENRSLSICQICGAAGSMRTDRGWYATLCDDHASTSRWGS